MLLDLPLEILQHILSYVSKDGLASTCRTAQSLNQPATAELYKDVVLDVYMTHQHPYMLGFAEMWMAKLHSLAMNTRNQCEYVRSFTFKNSHPGDLLPLLPAEPSLEPEDISYFMTGDTFVNCVEKHPPLASVCGLMEIALRHMHKLKDFTWTIPICPSNAVLAALSEKELSPAGSSNCYKEQWTYVPMCDNAIDDMNTLLFENRRSLRSLQIGYVKGYCYQGPVHNNVLLHRGSMNRSKQWSECELLPMLRDIIKADDPLKLHTLEIHKVDSIVPSMWLQAFDFTSVRNFALVDTRGFCLPAAAELWRYLKDMNVSFNRLVTDTQSPDLIDFISFFEGLETLLVCGCASLSRLKISEWLPALSNHFSTLKYLFIPRDGNGRGICDTETMRTILDGCPNLEEFGFAMKEEHLDDILNTLCGSSALRCIYVVTCLEKGTEDQLCSFKPYEFIDYFFKYFRQNPSPFFDRLEMLSYSRALYELHPTELDEDEREELKYEFTCRRIINEDEEEEEEVDDDDDEDGGRDGEDDDKEDVEEIEDTGDEVFPIKDRHYGEGYISHVFDEPYPDLIEKKRLSKVHQKMPVRVKWRDYSQSTIVNAVRFYVSSENWGEELFDGDDPIYEECPCGDHQFDESCWDGLDVPRRFLCERRCDVLFPSSSSSSSSSRVV